MATDFYLSLPSNASMKVHPDNTLAHYITDLPQRISVSGEWECGLAEIQYPHTWYNVREGDTWFYLNERNPVGRTPSTKIEAEYYRSPNVLLDHVNKALKPALPECNGYHFRILSIGCPSVVQREIHACTPTRARSHTVSHRYFDTQKKDRR